MNAPVEALVAHGSFCGMGEPLWLVGALVKCVWQQLLWEPTLSAMGARHTLVRWRGIADKVGSHHSGLLHPGTYLLQ